MRSEKMTQTAKAVFDLIYNEPHKIGHLLGFPDLTELHRDWIKSMVFGVDDETLLAHRGSFKTTCLGIAVTLLTILLPNKNIIFLRKTDDDVKKLVRQVTKALENSYIREIVKILYDIELVITESTVYSITTNLQTASSGDSQLLGLGIKASMTGKHGDIVITDDIVNTKDRESKAERDLTKRVYMELQNIKNRGGRIYNIGTPWHKEDAISIMPNVKRYDCYQTGLITKDELRKLQLTMTPSLFAANYELKHIADAEALFTNPKYVKNKKLLYGGVAHIDASYGGKDSTAYTIAKQHGDKFVMFGKRWNKHVDDCLSEILLLHKEYRAGSISCEKNADKGYLAKELRKQNLYVYEYSESTNKFIKISTHLKKNWASIAWLDDTCPEYMSEILDYTEQAEHDDAPDSAASILRNLNKQGRWIL